MADPTPAADFEAADDYAASVKGIKPSFPTGDGSPAYGDGFAQLANLARAYLALRQRPADKPAAPDAELFRIASEMEHRSLDAPPSSRLSRDAGIIRAAVQTLATERAARKGAEANLSRVQDHLSYSATEANALRAANARLEKALREIRAAYVSGGLQPTLAIIDAALAEEQD